MLRRDNISRTAGTASRRSRMGVASVLHNVDYFGRAFRVAPRNHSAYLPAQGKQRRNAMRARAEIMYTQRTTTPFSSLRLYTRTCVHIYIGTYLHRCRSPKSTARTGEGTRTPRRRCRRGRRSCTKMWRCPTPRRPPPSYKICHVVERTSRGPRVLGDGGMEGRMEGRRGGRQ